jgi:cytochrome c oxidase cbb3-type subunit 3
MKRLHTGLSLAAVAALTLMVGCDARLPGRPTEAERWRAPAEVSDFNQLYTQNCAGCHGAGGRLGAARSLNDPLYQSFVTDDALRQVVSQGRPGTSMPAFSQQAGGGLTDRQIELLISGMRSQWSRPDVFRGTEIPPYSTAGAALSSNADTANVADPDPANASPPGDSLRGAAAYQTYCARCHGTDGAGGSAGSIIDPNFLKLVSDQGLRTSVVVGRADLGKPDWRLNLPGRPMSQQEIDDVIAWVVSHRQAAGAVAADGDSRPSQLSPK